MPRFLDLMLIAVTALPAAASGQQEEFAPALPREGASLTLRNDLIDAWDVTWVVDSPTPMHRHDYDYLGVELTPSQTRLTAPDGGTRTISLERSRIWFLRKGVTHQETGLSDDPPRRAIIVELTGSPPAPVSNPTDYPSGPVAGSHPPVLDNARVTIWDVTWPPEPGEIRFYTRPVVLMFMEDVRLSWRSPSEGEETRAFEEGQVLFLPAGQARTVRPTEAPARIIVAELKDGT